MTTQELLHIFALDIQEGISDDQIGEQAEHLAKKIEALVRKETIEEILNCGISSGCVYEDEIEKYAQSKGITL